jgi:hypothetical protein
LVGGGGVDAPGVTVMEKSGSAVVANPSLALMTIPKYTPTSDGGGVPVSAPVVVSNFAQSGLARIENLSVRPLGSDAVGLKAYGWPATTVFAGVPVMTGACQEWRGHQRPVLVTCAAAAGGAQALERMATASAPSRLPRHARVMTEPNRFIFAPRDHPTVSQGEQTPFAADLEGSQSNSRRRVFSLTCRQPRYLEYLETGGFASPSYDGFALALGNIESPVTAVQTWRVCGPIRHASHLTTRDTVRVNLDSTLVTKCRAFRTFARGDTSEYRRQRTNTRMSARLRESVPCLTISLRVKR